MTDLKDILSIFSDSKSQEYNNKIIIFNLKKYSYIFSDLLYSKLKYLKYNISFLEVSNVKLTDLNIYLFNSFLGQQTIYFIKDIYLMDINEKKELYNYFISYNGPNIIILFDKDIDTKDFLVFNISDNIDINNYIKYYKFFYPNYNINNIFVKKIFDIYKLIDLDSGLSIMKYQLTFSSKNLEFFDKYLFKILIQEKSLFDLSGYFFQKQIKKFFELWLNYKSDYPIEFWISFWSDQIWQASLFVTILNKENILKARKYSYKLPFSFINKSYKFYNNTYLIKSHQELYNIDYNIKNDLGYNSLEIWFLKFLYNKFV